MSAECSINNVTVEGDTVERPIDTVSEETAGTVHAIEVLADDVHQRVDSTAPYVNLAEFHEGFHYYHLTGGAEHGAIAVAAAVDEAPDLAGIAITPVNDPALFPQAS